jgi:hypothetical protein
MVRSQRFLMAGNTRNSVTALPAFAPATAQKNIDIELRVADATARANALTHATLAGAFRGELVPTEAELVQRGRASGARLASLN